MRRTSWRRLLALAGGLLLAAMLLPLLFNLNRFHRQVQEALEAEFGRRVSLGSIELRLVPRVGLEAAYVTVEEDPAFGAEPFIRAEKLSCDLNVWSLAKRRLEFPHLAFTRPSINLVKNATGRWNLAAFLEQAGGPAAASPPADLRAGAVRPTLAGRRTSFSSLELEDARLNFKIREEKKVYALAETDARLERAAGDRWKLELEGRPIRSDRALTEAGILRVRGELGPLAGGYGELPLAIELELQKTQLADFLVFFFGQESGVLGRVEARARFTGTPRQLQTEGTAQISDIHGWDMLAPPGAPVWQLRYRVAIDALAGTVGFQELQVESSASRFQAAGSFTPWATPMKWEIRFAPLQLGLQDVFGLYAALHKGVDPEARVSGQAGGALTWTGPGHGLEGSLDWQGVALATRALAQGIEARRFRLDFARDGASLPGLSLTFRSASTRTRPETLDVAASWMRRGNLPTFKIHLASLGLRLERLGALAGMLGLDLTRSARLDGGASLALDYQGALTGEQRFTRRGWVELRAVHLTSPLLNEPISIQHARLEFAGSRVRIAPLAAQVAGADVTGNLVLLTEPSLSCTFGLDLGALDVDRLDQLLNPRRRRRLRLSTAVEEDRTLPQTAQGEIGAVDFFSRLRARGQLNVSRLLVRSVELDNLRAEVDYAARRTRLDKLRFELFGGRFAGVAQLDFLNPPGYRLEGQWERIDLERLLRATSRQAEHYSGILSARAVLETTGTDKRQLLDSLTGRGAFVVENGQITHLNLLAALERAAGLQAAPPVDPGTEVHSISGEFFLAEKRVRLSNALMVLGSASASVEGTADLEGRLNLALTAEPLLVAEVGPTPASPPRAGIFANRYRVTGTLSRPSVRLSGPIRARR